MVCYQSTEMYGITSKKNSSMLLTQSTLSHWAKMGLLTPELGASSYLGYDKKLENGAKREVTHQVTSINLTGHSAKDKRSWVNTATETEGFVGSEALNGFGTFTEERFTCDLNKEAAQLRDPDYANCTSVHGVVGYARKNSNICQLCNGPATVSFPRWSVSTKNGTHVGMPFIRMAYGTPFKTIPTTSRTVVINKNIEKLVENEETNETYTVSEPKRVKATSIQPRLYPVHLQGKGGRVARKINGFTEWVNVYFQQLVFEAENGQNFAVWCAVECVGSESKKLHQIFTPSPSEASVIVSNEFLNNDELAFVVAKKVNMSDELIPMVAASCTCSRTDEHFICDVEDGAGVV